MCACIGGLLFGFDQGILSIALTMPQFLRQFPETDASVTSGASLNKGSVQSQVAGSSAEMVSVS